MKKEIVIASGNKGKIKEAQEILDEYKIIPMKDIGINIEVEEDKETFRENQKHLMESGVLQMILE